MLLLLEYGREELLPLVAKWRMADVVSQTYCFGQVLIKPEATSDSPSSRRNKPNVVHPCANVVILREIKDLGLVSQATKRLRVDNPVNIPLKIGSEVVLILRPAPAARSYGCA